MNDNNREPKTAASFDRLSGISSKLLARFKRLSGRNLATYSVVSRKPPIFYVPRMLGAFEEFNSSFELLFNFLKPSESYFLCVWLGYAEEPKGVEAVKKNELKLNQTYPNLNFIHLCNTPGQIEVFLENNLNAILCNHNCMVDENIFKPISAQAKKFDALYDAQLISCKRHYLASQTSSVALIYYTVPTEVDFAYVEKVKSRFAHAHFFNHDSSGRYFQLSAPGVNEAINQCRVGLCLSEYEGAMYASVQYLLAGLPVVTTESVGGRDAFFDSAYVLTVEADPSAVKKGVDEIIERNIDPHFIRAQTLEKIAAHRQRFIDLVQSIYAAEGFPNKDFSQEWKHIFFNKLLKYQNHQTVIAQLANKNFSAEKT